MLRGTSFEKCLSISSSRTYDASRKDSIQMLPLTWNFDSLLLSQTGIGNESQHQLFSVDCTILIVSLEKLASGLPYVVS